MYGFLWLGGVATRGVAPNTGWASPLFLIVAGLLALSENPQAWRSLTLAAGLGCGFELLGVHTGLPFGRYAYTPALGPSFYGVPVTMAFAWLILIDFARAVTPSPFFGALVMVGVDFALDPVAAGPLQYWQWLDGGGLLRDPMDEFRRMAGCVMGDSRRSPAIIPRYRACRLVRGRILCRLGFRPPTLGSRRSWARHSASCGSRPLAEPFH